MLDDDLIFADEEDVHEKSNDAYWDILIVDDDHEVHSITKLALDDFTFKNKRLRFTSTYSASETKNLLDTSELDFALVLLDVVMEENNSGLNVVEYIRDTLKQELLRIIIRTGQPGEAPERYIIEHYDINDYKEKTELTTDRLFTSVRTALSDYQHMVELSNKKNELYEMLTTDRLTTLPNRFKLNIDIDTTKVQSLFLINIDSFSLINEAYGFEVGDELLKAVGKLLVNNLETKVNVYHLESDIFAILCNLEAIEIESLVYRIQEVILEHTFKIDSIDLRIRISIGIVKKELGNIVQKAEMALRQARSVSRNRVQMYSEDLDMINTISLNTLWSGWIREAIDKDRIFPYFQPIVDCKTKKIVKYEALVRLEKGGEVFAPASFLNTVKYMGLLFTITKIVFEKSCKKFQGLDMKFSINLSEQDLIEDGLAQFFQETAKKYNIPTKNISLEILENTSISDSKSIKKQLKILRGFGFELMIDDFGSECSNFGQIQGLDISTIKVDGQFIKDLSDDLNSSIILESILFFTGRIGVKTLAEYVHSKEVYDIVCRLGVDYAQGYYLGKPELELV